MARGVTTLGDATPRGSRGWAPVIEHREIVGTVSYADMVLKGLS